MSYQLQSDLRDFGECEMRDEFDLNLFIVKAYHDLIAIFSSAADLQIPGFDYTEITARTRC